MSQKGIIVSIDFELDWGYNKPEDPLTKEEALKGLDSLMYLFNKYNIKTTWAIVGKLFEDEDKEDNTRRQSNWIKNNLINNPLVEIGTHTYSHIFCEEVSDEIFENDILKVDKISNQKSIEFKSIVFPRNQFKEENLVTLKRFNYSHYRGVLDKWYLKTNKYSNESIIKRFLLRLIELFPVKRDVIIRKNKGLVSISDSRFLRFMPSSLVGKLISPIYYRILRYEMKKTFKRGNLYHIWFHPHNFIKNPLSFNQLERVLKYYDKLKKEQKDVKSFKFTEIN